MAVMNVPVLWVCFWAGICVPKGSTVWVTLLQGLRFIILGIDEGQGVVETQ